MRRVGVYCRISKDAKGLHLGVQRQEEDCRALCERRGWQVAQVYVDNDRSAYSGRRRPEYERMLADIEAGTVDAVVAWHPDRLHRSPKELERFIDLIEAVRAEVATVQGGDYDLSTASGRMSARIVGAVARHESEQKSERIRRAHEELAKNGLPVGGMRPFGYQADLVTVEPEEAAVVRELADRVLRGESLRAIARDLNARGIRTPTGRQWKSSHVGRMLKRPGLAGLREHHGEIIGPATWDAVLDRATWDRVHAILSDPSRVTYRPVRTYLLSTIAHCGVCGQRLYAGGPETGGRGKGDHGHGHRRYRCRVLVVTEPRSTGETTNSLHGAHVGCRAEPLEDYVVEVVLQAIERGKLREAAATKQESPELAAEIQTLADDLAAIDGEFGSGSISRARWIGLKSTLEARLANLQQIEAEQRRHSYLRQLGLYDNGVDVRARWAEMNFAERHALLADALEKVVLHPFKVRGRYRFDPGRVSFVWRA